MKENYRFSEAPLGDLPPELYRSEDYLTYMEKSRLFGERNFLAAQIITIWKDLQLFLKAFCSWQIPDEFPELVFVETEEINAMASPYQVRITTGLIRLIVSADPVVEVGSKASEDIGSKSGAEVTAVVAWTMMYWALAHEAFHVLRKHSEIKVEESENIAFALEYDADCMATAAVYRLIQHKFPSMQSIEIKRHLLNVIYYFMRRTTSTSEISGTHPHCMTRLTSAVGKLAILDQGSADPGIDLPESMRHLEDLSSLLGRLERKYLDTVLVEASIPVRRVLHEHLTNVELRQLVGSLARQWETVRQRVEELNPPMIGRGAK